MKCIVFTLFFIAGGTFSIYCQGIKIVKIQSNLKEHTHDLTARKISLAAEEDNLSISFTADSSIKNFKYRLINFEQETTLVSFPLARYTGLTGGHFTFKVWNSENPDIYDEILVDSESRLTETKWFYPLLVSCILIILGIIAFFWTMYNYRQKLRLERLRNKLASDLHDEVGATLSSISLSIRTAKRRLGDKAPEVVEILNKITSAADETGHNLRDTVWTINPKYDTIEEIFERIRSFALTILMAQDIVLHYDNQLDETQNIKISMEQRRNIYLIIKEAINNIAKHSKAQNAWINISKESEGVRMIIKDDGIGFDSDTKNDGNGLKNFKQRAQESCVELEISSELTKGTIISLLIPEI